MKGINDFNPMRSMRIEEMEIAYVDPRSWIIRVGPIGSPQTRELQYVAKLLSPIPQGEDGSGLFAVPKVGDSCTVLINTEGGYTTAYILGYRAYPSQDTGGSGGVTYKTGMEQGDLLILNRIGIAIKSSIRGGLHFIVDGWAKLMIGMTNQELRGWFRNIYWRARGGRIDWETNKETEESQYLQVITDKFEMDENNDARDVTARLPQPLGTGFETPIYANKEITKIGSWGEGQAFKTVEIRAGASAVDELPQRVHYTQYVVPNGPEKVTVISGLSDVLTMRILDYGPEENKLYLDITTRGALDPYCSIAINADGCTVSHTGDVNIVAGGSIHVDAADSIVVGGDGEEQQLVTKKFVEDIFMEHTHLGNNGAPTSTPLNNAAILSPASRSSANHFTKDTVAE